jgi:hypothetical protein
MTEDVSLNVEAMRQAARDKFFKSHRNKRKLRELSFRELIEASVPNWLIIVALALFLLSAPHTVRMFNMLTPGFGGAGVLLCEFGLLYIAFRRRMEMKINGKLPLPMWGLLALLFMTAVIVNGAGALLAVIDATGTQDLSMQMIMERLSTMSVVSQVGLVLVPFVALIIPIGSAIAGEGLASFVLEGKQSDADLITEWTETEQLETYHIAFSYLVQQGMNARDAKRKAGSAVKNYFADQGKSIASTDNERTPKRQVVRTATRQRRADAKSAARKYIQENPETVHKPSRQIEKVTGISRSVIHKVQQELKAEWGIDPEDTQPAETDIAEV